MAKEKQTTVQEEGAKLRKDSMAAKIDLLEVDLDEIKPHPENEKYFPTTPIGASEVESYNELFQDIRKRGIQTPLIVNWETKHILAGHRRYGILKKLKRDRVKILTISISPDHELMWMMADNEERRESNPFTKMRYVGYIRDMRGWTAGKGGKAKEEGKEQYKTDMAPRDAIAKEINESHDFVSMADLFNSLSEKRQQELIRLFNEDSSNGKVTKETLYEKLKKNKIKKKPTVLSTKEVSEVESWGKNAETFKGAAELEKKVQAGKIKLNGVMLAASCALDIEKLCKGELLRLLEEKPDNEEAVKAMGKYLKRIYGQINSFWPKFQGQYREIFNAKKS